MNRGLYSAVPKSTSSQANVGVYADLRSLTGMEYRARGFSLLPRQPVNSLLFGRRGSRLRGRGLDFVELRQYVQGDDIRNMDWKATARLRSPHVRVYTEERDRPCLLIVDQRLSMFFGSQRAMKSVAAAEAAALTAWRVFHAQDRVGAIIFDDESFVEIAPGRSRSCVQQILTALVKKNRALSAQSRVTPRPEMLNQALQQVVRLARHDHLIVLITDGMGGNSESMQYGNQLAVHNDVVVAFVFDPLEAAVPDAGRLTLSDGRQQLEIDSSKSDVRDHFKRDFDDRLSRLQDVTRRRQIPLLPISAAEEVLPQIQRHLGSRPPLRSR